MSTETHGQPGMYITASVQDSRLATQGKALQYVSFLAFAAYVLFDISTESGQESKIS
jgi:hypothetical protein